MLPEGITPDNQDRQNLIAITRLLQVCCFINYNIISFIEFLICRNYQIKLLIKQKEINGLLLLLNEIYKKLLIIYMLFVKIQKEMVCHTVIKFLFIYFNVSDPPYSRFLESTAAEVPRNQFINPKCVTFLHDCIYINGLNLLDYFGTLPPVIRSEKGKPVPQTSFGSTLILICKNRSKIRC